jgi:hypothetical protein
LAMPPDPIANFLGFFPFSVIVLYAPAMVLTGLAVWYLRRRLSRIERRQQQHRHIREDIVAAGVERRKRMALTSQRRNIGELAGLVRKQLEDHKLKMSPYMRQRVSVFIEQAVTSLDFDRLYALHALFSNYKGQDCVSPAMELFFEHKR